LSSELKELQTTQAVVFHKSAANQKEHHTKTSGKPKISKTPEVEYSLSEYCNNLP